MKKKRRSPYTLISVALLSMLALLFIFPLYWIVTGSIKEKADILLKSGEAVQWFPLSPTIDNYTRLFKNPALRWLGNSVFISVAAMVLTCICSSLAGYALAKKEFYGKTLIFSLFVCAMALPKQAILIPLLSLSKFLHITETPWAVIFPIVGWPFGVFLMKQFSESIPRELLEACTIDGAGEIQTFISLVLPLIQPGIGALAIFTFINAWNEYPLQLVMLHDTSVKTIALGIAGLQAEMSTDYGLIMAGAALGSIPIIAIFIMFQKYFTQGITMGAVKG